MNADRLLAHYERIADAPDAIPRLRRFILDLAVRGKLAEQDPKDEPASELLKRIEAEKARLVKAGEIKKSKSRQADRVKPIFDLPKSWQWVALCNLFLYDAGAKRHARNLNQKLWLLELEDIEKGSGRLLVRVTVSERESKSTKSEFRVGDILYGKLRPYLNKVLVADRPGYSTTEIVALRPFLRLCPQYCALALRRPDFVDYVTRLGQGTKMPRLRTEDAVIAPFPLPPVAEQHRIVAKVEELMALCDRLETARAARESTRDRLAVASLARLNEPDPDPAVFQNHVSFALDNLIPLTIRPDQIKALRQTILNLSVRGKLVEQDPHDEPASELLKRTAERKRQLKVKHYVVPLAKEERPFRLPVGWQWSRIGELCTKTGSGSTPRGGKNVYMESGVPFLRSQNVYDDGLRMDDVAYVGPDVHARMTGTAVRPRDLLLNITGGSMGRCCHVPEQFDEANVSQHVAIIRPAISEMSDFLHKLVLSPCFQAFIFDEQTGAGRGGLPKKKMDRIAVAVPPQAEQHRIVAKVDELMALCDRLEASLVAGNDARSRLLDALLHVALSPSNEEAPREISAISQDLPAKSPGAIKALAHPTPSDTSPE